MKIFIPKQVLSYLLVVLLAVILSILIFEVVPNDNVNDLKFIIIYQFIIFVFLFVFYGKLNKSIITLYSVFMIVFYLFQNGQLVLYAFNVKFDYFYIKKFPISDLCESVRFSTLCMCSAFAAGVFTLKEKQSKLVKSVDSLSLDVLLIASKVGVFLSGVVAYFLLIIKIMVWTGGGYSRVREFETLVPSLIGAIEALFPAFSILAIISAVKRNKKTRYFTMLFGIWGVLTSLIGDRTTGLGVIVIISLMLYKGVYVDTKNANSKFGRKFLFGTTIIGVLFLISFIASFRNQNEYSISSMFNVVTDVVSELGFSFFPLVAIMNMCPEIHPFLYGESMFGSVVAGFVPSSIDIFGLFERFADVASVPTHWIANKYQYGFGMDCSLNAECFANFGEWGFFAMFAICVVIASMLKNVDYTKNKNVFSQYIGFSLLFAWFTLPRRRSYYIYNKIFWYVIIVAAFIGLVYLFVKKKRGK